MSESESTMAGSPNPFPETSLSLYQRVLSDNPMDSQQALEEFFQRYWYPMYAFMRAQRETHDDASDLVQAFIVNELLEREQIKQWDPKRGRLRTFLKVALDRFRKKEFRKESAQKRGGPKAQTHVSMDFEWAEGRFANTAIDEQSPDKIFEKEWAEATINQVMGMLAQRYSKKDKLKEFQLLCQNLSGRAGDGDHVKYSEIALELGTNENNVKAKMLAFRDQFKRALDSVVSETAAPGEVEDEVSFVSNLMMGRIEG
tara:strand:+ start:16299 stop:17069 length:771 start_codon:yes stop_codon:yes gene_type:complete